MRVFAFVATVLATTVLLVGATFLLYEVLGPSGMIIGSSGVGLLVYGPVLLGSLSAYWHTRSADSRTPVRRWIAIVAVMDAIGAALVITATVISGGPVWLPVLVILVGLALVVVAVAIGRAVLRWEGAAKPKRTPDWDRTEVKRKVRLVAIVFVAVLVIGAGSLGVVLGSDHFLDAGLYALALAFMCAAFAALWSGRSLSMQLREVANRDLGLVHKFGQVILKAKDELMSEEEELAAARYATIAPAALGFQLGGITLLYLGLALQRVDALLSNPRPIDWILLGLLAVVFVAVVPIIVRQMRRARTYAATHPQPVEP